MDVIMERLIIFIDGSYLFKSFKSIRECYLKDMKGEYRHNPVQLADIFSQGYSLQEKHYYGSINSFNAGIAAKQARFHTYLHIRGFHMTIMDLKIIGGEHKEKGVDGSINVDMNELAHDNKYDVGILVAADGDFTEPGVKRVQEKYHKKIINASFKNRTAYGLKNACDGHISLDALAFIHTQDDPKAFFSLNSLYGRLKLS